jgi:FlaA1/EpsC-like NDP-sugar epimerase
MGLIVIYWFLISVNSNVLQINRLSTTISVSKDILIAYSVLSTITIATVAIFGEFRPNDKLILYPLLFGAISSTVLRLFYLIISKHCLKHGYLQKSVLLVGSGHTARQLISKIMSTPQLGFRIRGVLSDNDLVLPDEGLYLGKLEQFSDILQRDPIDEVIIAESSSETDAIRRIVDQMRRRRAAVLHCTGLL